MNKCKNKLIKIHDMENFNKECKGQKLHAKKTMRHWRVCRKRGKDNKQNKNENTAVCLGGS